MENDAIKLLELQCQIYAELRQFVRQLDRQKYIEVQSPRFSWLDFAQESGGILSGGRFQIDLLALQSAASATAWSLSIHWDRSKWLVDGLVSQRDEEQDEESVIPVAEQEANSVSEMCEVALQVLAQLVQHK